MRQFVERSGPVGAFGRASRGTRRRPRQRSPVDVSDLVASPSDLPGSSRPAPAPTEVAASVSRTSGQSSKRTVAPLRSRKPQLAVRDSCRSGIAVAAHPGCRRSALPRAVTRRCCGRRRWLRSRRRPAGRDRASEPRLRRSQRGRGQTRSRCPARADVLAGGAAQRGCEAIAILPPGRNGRPQGVQTSHGVPPEPHRVDGKDLVDGLTEVGECLDRAATEVDATGLHGRCVAPSRLSHHDLGVIDAQDGAPRGKAAGARNGETGTEPDLEDPMRRRCTSQQRDDPAVASTIRRAVRQRPAGQTSAEAVGVHELADHASDDALAHGCWARGLGCAHETK